jgi:hypothetical protein
MKLDSNEMFSLCDKVGKIIEDRGGDYYTFYCAPCDTELSRDGSYVEFIAKGHSTQWEGQDWEDTWSVQNDGSISNEEKTWKNFEEFDKDYI